MTTANKVTVLNQGVLQQLATPDELYNRPKNVFVATFIGSPSINRIEASLASKKEPLGSEVIVHVKVDELIKVKENPNFGLEIEDKAWLSFDYYPLIIINYIYLLKK